MLVSRDMRFVENTFPFAKIKSDESNHEAFKASDEYDHGVFYEEVEFSFTKNPETGNSSEEFNNILKFPL